MTVSLISQRVFHGTTDISVAVSDFRVGTYALTYTAGQYIYIGTPTPFTNLWVEMSTAASSSVGAPTVQMWWAQSWTNAVDVIDQTSGMTESGRISWATDRLKGWNFEQESTTVGLTGTAVYNRYWVRISWGSSFTAGMAFIGQKFSSDTILQSMYPDLLQPQIISGFKSGKTNWDEQHFMAAEAIIRDLRKRSFIKERGQILDWSVFEEASAHKVAELVYMAFGLAYKDQADNARRRYEAEIASRLLVIDETMDGHVDYQETIASQGWINR